LVVFLDVFMFTLPPLPCRRSEKPYSEKPYNAILETASPQKTARSVISATLLTGFTHFVLLKISKIAYRAVVLPPCGPSHNPQARRDRGSQKRAGEARLRLVESFDSRV
jgi:hypothetical protein